MVERCNFVVGQKVVCWRAPIGQFGSTAFDPAIHEFPQVGKVYTIMEMEPDSGFVFLGFKELSKWVACDYRGFKPLAERETSIEVFTEILRKVNEGAPVDAFADCSAWC